MLSVQDVQDILSIDLLGVIPESKAVLTASNQGIPVIHDDKSDAGQAYADAVARLLGESVEQRFIEADRKSTRLNSSHVRISYAVFCLKKKKKHSPISSTLLH